MPFYIVGGCRIHIKFSGRGKPPAPCAAQAQRANVIQRCFDISTYLCDWPVNGRQTCDAPLCAAHAREVGRNRHYCPRHQAEGTYQAPQRDLFTGLLTEEAQ